MDESETPKNQPIDLSSLEGLTLGTAWTPSAPASPRSDRPDYADRPRRSSFGGERSDRRPGQRDNRGNSSGANNRGPRDSSGGNGNSRGSFGNTRGANTSSISPGGRSSFNTQGGRDSRSHDNRGSQDSRHDFRGRDSRGSSDFRPAPIAPPTLSVIFYPEEAPFRALTKAIKASNRTYELFEIARLILEKAERVVATVSQKPTPESKSPPLFQSAADGALFLTEAEALQYACGASLEKFFKTEEVEVDGPKGNFVVIHRCGITGKLIAPPNYHRYAALLAEHQAKNLPNMSLAAIQARLETVKEPEVIAQWVESQKKITRYTLLIAPGTSISKKAQKNSNQKPTAAAPAAEAGATTPSETSPAISQETPATAGNSTPDTSATPEASTASENSGATISEPSSPIDTNTSVNPETTSTTSTDVTSPISPLPSPAPLPHFDNPDAAAAYLAGNFKDALIKKVPQARLTAKQVDVLPKGEIRRSIEAARALQLKFPLETANNLRGRLRRMGFNLYKRGQKGVSYLSAVKRKFRLIGQTFAPEVQQVIEFIEKNPNVADTDLPKQMLGITVPAPAPLAETLTAEATATAPSNNSSPAEVASSSASASSDISSEAAANSDLPENSAEKPSEVAAKTPAKKAPASNIITTPLSAEEEAALRKLRQTLQWLVEEGYVIHFGSGKFFVAPARPANAPKAEDEEEDATPADAATEASLEPTTEAAPADTSATETPKPAVEEPKE